MDTLLRKKLTNETEQKKASMKISNYKTALYSINNDNMILLLLSLLLLLLSFFYLFSFSLGLGVIEGTIDNNKVHEG